MYKRQAYGDASCSRYHDRLYLFCGDRLDVYKRQLMVVAGDHANNDMAGDDEDSWKTQFVESGAFDSVDSQIEGLGRIDAVEQLYVAHTQAAIDSLGK